MAAANRKYSVRGKHKKERWNYDYICFAALKENPVYPDRPVHPFNGTRNIYYALEYNFYAPIVKEYIQAVLKHPIFLKLYSGIKFKYGNVNGNKVLICRLSLTHNYKYSLFYLSLVRFIDENMNVICAWYDLYSKGIDPIQALMLACLGPAKNEHLYYNQFKAIEQRNRACDHNIMFAYRWVGDDANIFLPIKNWPIQVLMELSTRESPNIHGIGMELFIPPKEDKPRYRLASKIKEAYNTGDYDKLNKLLNNKLLNW